MTISSNRNQIFVFSQQIPLRWILIIPFIIQIFTAVGIVGYLSIRNGQSAVTEVTEQLRSEVSSRIEQRLDTYLATPHLVNALAAKAIRRFNLWNLDNMRGMEDYFFEQLIQFPNLSYVGFGGEEREFAGAGRSDDGSLIADLTDRTTNFVNMTYELNSQGELGEQISISPDYDPTVRPWYRAAIEANGAVWTDIYLTSDEKRPVISAVEPFYDRDRTLRGVLVIDLSLWHISEFLQNLKIGKTGEAFIMERDGLLIASSTLENPPVDEDGEPQRLSASDSDNQLIRASITSLQEEFNSLEEIKASQQLTFAIGDRKQLLQVTPIKDDRGLDWLIVVAVPEADFMAQIDVNTRQTILLCSIALIVATILGIFTSRWITRPILDLNRASKAIAEGDFQQHSTTRGIKELNSLGISFARMAEQLQDSFTTLETNNEILEKRVEERTAELQDAKLAADSANQAKSEFLANMSHELRTPLNGILGYAQILQRDRQATAKQKDGVTIIHQCGSHLLNLINDVLDLSKIEARKLELFTKDFDFEVFLKGVVEICRIKAEQKEIGFTYKALNHLPAAIHTDDKRLRQVLINLLGNAIKFTDRGGVTLKVGVIESVDSSELTTIGFQVEDSGVGMSSEQLEKIFQPFEQVGESDRKAEGTGLGLAISRQIVEMMGGELQVESQMHRGSTFSFAIAVAEVENWSELSSAQPSQQITGYQGQRQKILVVDDRWENRAVIINLLEPLDFELQEAENGKQGIERAKTWQPDLIVTDLVMPVMNGFEMTKALRSLSEFSEIPIIASSASVFNFDRQKSREVGCSDFLPKPVQVDELLAQLQTYLNLEWIIEDNEGTEFQESGEMIYPTEEEVMTIRAALDIGDFDELELEGSKLERHNSQYAPFARKLLALVREYDEKAISQLLVSTTVSH
ncbi:hybrid sensor histidine kinase/response regulator [Roseofilum casamattae]|uniref:histidine kinase n=1 Tax=Roseofilum casamattae BLCC-M143 TaxID=3022442 RepID=A0ABT7BTA7_9CYAN|nr:hybrid sensor histidine kinase/response regulator [Roseofilum casamattae]MDJ1182418.1 ATP-binding protein [Roseofilum casamattae BLCC-M143]